MDGFSCVTFCIFATTNSLDFDPDLSFFYMVSCSGDEVGWSFLPAPKQGVSRWFSSGDDDFQFGGLWCGF